MAELDQPWGFWVRIKDRDSALYAMRMAGLPVFLSGLTGALISIVDPADSQAGFLVGWAIAAMLIMMGLMIRKGRFGLVPFAAALMLINIGLSIASSILITVGIARLDLLPVDILFMEFIRLSVFPVLFLLVMVSGLRGWRWLRQSRS